MNMWVLYLHGIGIESMAGTTVYSVFYGLVSGSFVSFGGLQVFSLTNDLQLEESCLDMITGIGRLSPLLGNPIACALLDHRDWRRLQLWNGSMRFVAHLTLL